MKLMQPRYLFGSAGLFNWLAGLPVLLAGRQICALFGLPPPSSLVFMQITGMAILVFGTGYWLEALQPGRHRSVVVLGGIAKVGVFLIAFGHLLAGGLNGVLPTLAAVDLSYAILFWLYLKQIPAR